MQGMDFMYSMVEDRLTAGFAGLRTRLSSPYKPQQPSSMIGTTPSAQFPPVTQQPQYNVRQAARMPPPQHHHMGPMLDHYAGPMPGGPVDMFMGSADAALLAR